MYQPITKNEYCINTVDRKLQKINKKSAGKGTKIKKKTLKTFVPITSKNSASEESGTLSGLVVNKPIRILTIEPQTNQSVQKQEKLGITMP